MPLFPKFNTFLLNASDKNKLAFGKFVYSESGGILLDEVYEMNFSTNTNTSPLTYVSKDGIWATQSVDTPVYSYDHQDLDKNRVLVFYPQSTNYINSSSVYHQMPLPIGTTYSLNVVLDDYNRLEGDIVNFGTVSFSGVAMTDDTNNNQLAGTGSRTYTLSFSGNFNKRATLSIRCNYNKTTGGGGIFNIGEFPVYPTEKPFKYTSTFNTPSNFNNANLWAGPTINQGIVNIKNIENFEGQFSDFQIEPLSYYSGNIIPGTERRTSIMRDDTHIPSILNNGFNGTISFDLNVVNHGTQFTVMSLFATDVNFFYIYSNVQNRLSLLVQNVGQTTLVTPITNELPHNTFVRVTVAFDTSGIDVYIGDKLYLSNHSSVAIDSIYSLRMGNTGGTIAPNYFQIKNFAISPNKLSHAEVKSVFNYKKFDKMYKDLGYSVPKLKYTIEYQRVLNEAIANGFKLPSERVRLLHNAIILELKRVGVWSKLDLLYIFLNDVGSDFARINWKNPSKYLAELVNNPIYSNTTGFKGDGSSSYINTWYSPSDTGLLTTNNIVMGGMVSTTGLDTGALWGTRDVSNHIVMYVDDKMFLNSANTGGNHNNGAPNTNSHIMGYRGSSAGQYRTLSSTNNYLSEPSTGLVDNYMLLLCRNNSSDKNSVTPVDFSDRSIEAFWMGGDSMNTTDMRKIINNYTSYI